MSDLAHMSPLEAAKDIAEGAAVTYWLRKATSNDPRHVEPPDGRIVRTVKVRNHAEYAGVAAGQVAVANVAAPFILKLFFFPIWLITFVLAILPVFLMEIWIRPGSGLDYGLGIPIVLFDLYLWVRYVVWRWTIKRFFRWLLNCGPKISYADNYRGPFG